MRKLFIVCLIALFSFVMCVPVMAEDEYEIIIQDDANLLTQEEEIDLYESMRPLAEYGNVAFVTTNKNDLTAEDYCLLFYEQHWDISSMVMLLIDMDNRIIRLQCDGYIYSIVNDDYGDTITDNIYSYASEGDYYKCAVKAFSQVNSLLLGEKIAQPMKYITNALLALLIAVVAMFIYVNRLIKQKAISNDEMLKYIGFSFGMREITKKLVARRKIEYSSASSDSGGYSSSYSSGSSSRSYSSSSSSRSYSSSSSRSSSSGPSRRSGGGGQHKF